MEAGEEAGRPAGRRPATVVRQETVWLGPRRGVGARAGGQTGDIFCRQESLMDVECEGERELQGDSQVFQLSSYGTEWQSGAETDTRVGERKAGPVLSPGARPGLEPGKRWRKQRRRLTRTSR